MPTMAEVFQEVLHPQQDTTSKPLTMADVFATNGLTPRPRTPARRLPAVARRSRSLRTRPSATRT
jgi:hypothetical protein